MITFRKMVPITKNLYHEIRKNRRLDLGFFVSSVHLSSQQTKKKRKKKSFCIATLPPSLQEQPHELGRSLPVWFAQARMALNSSVYMLQFTLAGDLALCNGNGQISQ